MQRPIYNTTKIILLVKKLIPQSTYTCQKVSLSFLSLLTPFEWCKINPFFNQKGPCTQYNRMAWGGILNVLAVVPTSFLTLFVFFCFAVRGSGVEGGDEIWAQLLALLLRLRWLVRWEWRDGGRKSRAQGLSLSSSPLILYPYHHSPKQRLFALSK